MSKVLFVYNDYNDVAGISNAMAVAERYALKSQKGKFWVNSKPSPSIQFEEGTTISILPLTKGVPPLGDFDEIYIDDTISTFVDTHRFQKEIEFYDNQSFK